MVNGSGGFRVYTRLGFFLASIGRRGAIHTTVHESDAAVMSRAEAVRALSAVRGAGLSCWIVPA